MQVKLDLRRSMDTTPRFSLARTRSAQRLAQTIAQWGLPAGSSIHWYEAGQTGLPIALSVTSGDDRLAKSPSPKTLEFLANTHRQALARLLERGGSMIWTVADVLDQERLAKAFDLMLNRTCLEVVSGLIGSGISPMFAPQIAELHQISTFLPNARRFIDESLADSRFDDDSFNPRREMYTWLEANYPLPTLPADLNRTLTGIPMADMEKTGSIQSLAMQLAQIATAITANRLFTIREKFDLGEFSLWGLDRIIRDREYVHSREEIAGEPSSPKTLVTKDERFPLTEFEQELAAITAQIWQCFGLANERRLASDSRIQGAVQAANAAIEEGARDHAPMVDRMAEMGFRINSARFLLGEVLEDKLRYIFNLSFPELGKMLFELRPMSLGE